MREWLKSFRKAKNLTQHKVAEGAGITRQYYNFIENGKRGVPVDTAQKIAAVLGFDWTVFYNKKAS